MYGVESSAVNFTLHNHGEIAGGGIRIAGNNAKIYNEGSISGSFDGIFFVSTGFDAQLYNTGFISSQFYGLYIDAANIQIFNDGTLNGGQFGVFGNNNNALTVRNTGTVNGGLYSIFGSSGGDFVWNSGSLLSTRLHLNNGNDTLINQGSITGYVALGFGNDVYDGRGGTVQLEVFGEAGDDRFIIDDATLVLVENENEGIDTVATTVTYTLRAHFENLELIGSDAINGYGNTLNNVITGNDADNVLSGRGGDDLLIGGAGDDYLHGGVGNDTLGGEEGDDDLRGGAGIDLLDGGNGDDVLLGGEGDDTIIGGDGDDDLRGETGNDSLDGGFGDDVMTGGDGDDTLIGGPGADDVRGGAGFDTLTFAASSSAVRVFLTDVGGVGYGELGDSLGDTYREVERVIGSEFSDLLSGSNGDDFLIGGHGRDTLIGREGNDVINGGLANDRLTGNGGTDTFVFDQVPSPVHADTITDFTPDVDKIALSIAAFGPDIGTVGALDPSIFALNAATDPNHRIVYVQATGELFYDQNGSAAGGLKLFATLTGAPVIDAGDFLIWA